MVWLKCLFRIPWWCKCVDGDGRPLLHGLVCSPQGSVGKVGLMALTSPHIVPEMVFAGTPLKCLRELDRAWAEIPEKNAKSVDIHGIIILPYKKEWQAVSQGEKSTASSITCICRGLYTFCPKAFNIHYLPKQPCWAGHTHNAHFVVQKIWHWRSKLEIKRAKTRTWQKRRKTGLLF